MFNFKEEMKCFEKEVKNRPKRRKGNLAVWVRFCNFNVLIYKYYSVWDCYCLGVNSGVNYIKKAPTVLWRLFL